MSTNNCQISGSSDRNDVINNKEKSRDQLTADCKTNNVTNVLLNVSAMTTNLSQDDLFSHMPQPTSILTSTPMINSLPSSYNVSKKQVDHLTPLEEPNSEAIDHTFQCLQLSGEVVKESASSTDDIVSPTSSNLKPESPTEDLPKTIDHNVNNLAQAQESLHSSKETNNRQVVEKIDDNQITKNENETSLPEWQKQCLNNEDKLSSLGSVTTVSRTMSNNSNSDAKEMLSGSKETSLRQWQSPQEGSDDLFEDDSNEVNSDGPTNNHEVPSGPTNVYPKGLALPEMSQDILCHRPKAAETEKVIVLTDLDSTNMADKEQTTSNDVVAFSQDCFRLYLTQSQSSQRKQNEFSCFELAANESAPEMKLTPVSETAISLPSSEHPDSTGTDKEVQKLTSEQEKGKAWQLQKEQQPKEEQQQDQEKQQQQQQKQKAGVTNSDSIMSSCDDKSQSSESVKNLAEKTTLNFIPIREATSVTTTDNMGLLTDSTDLSGNERFHFSPPTILLQPTLNNPPVQSLEITNTENSFQTKTGSEESQPEMDPTQEFNAIFPEVQLTRRLSLSVPVHCDDNDEEENSSPKFHFSSRMSDFIPEEANISVEKPAQSIFTNIRERFQSATSKPVEQTEFNPFEFTKFTGGNRDIANGQENNQTERPKETLTKSTCIKTRITTTTTIMTEREITTTYTDKSGLVVSSETRTEFDEPIQTTSVAENEEKSEVVDERHVGLEIQKNPRKRPRSQTEANSEDLSKEKPKRSKRGSKGNSSVSAREPFSLRKTSFGKSEEVRFRDGLRVLALWFDKHYYPGTIMSKVQDSGRYRVKFDDGDSRDMLHRDILVVDCLPRGQPVMFREHDNDCYSNGVIKGFYNNWNEQGYKIVEDGSDRVRHFPRSTVILDSEQAAIFRALQASTKSHENDIVSPSTSSPRTRSAERARCSKGFNTDFPESSETTAKTFRSSAEKATRTPRKSGENSAEGLRYSGKRAASLQNSIASNSPNSEKNSNQSRRFGDVAKTSLNILKNKGTKQKNDSVKCSKKDKVKTTDRQNKKVDKNVGEKSGRKHERTSSSETPKSSHKSKKRGGVDDGESHDDNCGNLGTRVGKVRRRLSIAIQKESEGKKVESMETCLKKLPEDQNEDLILPTNQDLFRGYGFVITGSDVTCASHEEENSPTEEDHSFNRKQVCRQIIAGGGVILKTFPNDPSADASYLLLSNSCQTTAKYFYALVSGVPCLSHVWVRDCCIGNKLMWYQNYLLPVGKDLITGRMIEKQEASDALRGIKVYLTGEEEFRIQWKKVLNAAGCVIVTKLPANIVRELQYGTEEFECDVIVVGSGHVPHGTIRKARLLGIPTVTIHWLKQCILTGTRVNYSEHPSFTYRAKGEN